MADVRIEGITTWCGTADRGVVHTATDPAADLASGPVHTLCGRTLRLLPLTLRVAGDRTCRSCTKVRLAEVRTTPAAPRLVLHRTKVVPRRYA